MQIKIKKWMIKYKYFLLALAVLIVPILLNYILFSWRAKGVNGDWLGFTGNYSGGIIGGITAYLVARLQIKSFDEQEEEKTKLRVRPYLRLLHLRQDNRYETFTDVIFNEQNDDAGHPSGTIPLALENIGMGNAVNVNFETATGMPDNIYKADLSMKIGEKHFIKYTLYFPNNQYAQYMVFEITYDDLLGNHYQQNLSVSCLDQFRDHIKELKILGITPPVQYVKQ